MGPRSADGANVSIGGGPPRPGVDLIVDGRPLAAAPGTTVAAAMLDAGVTGFRASTAGAARGPVCGMGICFECRVTIDGVAHRRACMVSVAEGMRVETTAAPPGPGRGG